jgi:hypothetical protein
MAMSKSRISDPSPSPLETETHPMQLSEQDKWKRVAQELSEGATRQIVIAKPVFSGGSTHPPGTVLELPENQALHLCLTGAAKVFGAAVSWFQDLAKEVAKKFKPASPVEPVIDLDKPPAEAETGPFRLYKVKTRGSHGVFRGSKTYVGVLYLDEKTARAELAGRHIELIDPKVLPALPEPKFVVRKNPSSNDPTVTLIPA